MSRPKNFRPIVKIRLPIQRFAGRGFNIPCKAGKSRPFGDLSPHLIDHLRPFDNGQVATSSRLNATRNASVSIISAWHKK
jgi:hypothetical protein